MPWSKHHVPKYRKHRPTGQAVVTLKGRDFYLGPHGTKASQVEYDRLIAEWLANGRHDPDDDPDGVTVAVLCDRYLTFAQGYYAQRDGRCAGEISGVVRMMKTVLAFYADRPVTDLRPLALEAIRNQWIADGLARTYVNKLAAKLVRMVKWAVGKELAPAGVYQALAAVPGLRRGKTAARETERVQPVDDATVDATLPHLSRVVADMVRFQRLTGARPGEVCDLRPGDIDRTGEVWLYRPREHKTEHHGRERTIYVGPRAQAVLARYLFREPDAFCFSPAEAVAERRAAASAARKTPLSCGNRPGSNRRNRPRKAAGDRYDSRAYFAAVRYACERAFPHPTIRPKRGEQLTAQQRDDLAAWRREHLWSPNQLRHAAATEYRRLHGLEAAQILLGHSKADVTQVYAERDESKAVAVAAAVG